MPEHRPAAEDLVAALRAGGLRVTRPRRAVCEVLADPSNRHLTASGLKDLAEEEAGSPIDLSTIYRTIDALETAGLLRHVHLGHGPSVLHLSDRLDHHHLVCEVCGRTEDVPLEELTGLIRTVEDRHGFVADSVHFALVGRCSRHETETVGELRGHRGGRSGPAP